MERIRHTEPENEKIGDGVLKMLCLSLQLLAAPAQAQLAHFSVDWIVLTDELVLDFDHWFRALPTYWIPTDEQLAALTRLDQLIDVLSGPANIAFWTNEALTTDPRWEEIRTLAKAALIACGWPVQIPPPARDENGIIVDNASLYMQWTNNHAINTNDGLSEPSDPASQHS